MKVKPFTMNYKVLIIFIFIGLGLSSFANNYNQKKPYFDHLFEINKQWAHHKSFCPQGTISFQSDIDRIQLHLNLVIDYLKSNIPEQFNEIQRSNRLSLLKKLQEYADKKVFPINNHHFKRTPYFVDDYGKNCAVGQMIYVSGHQNLVDSISKQHNYDYIESIHTSGLKEWAEEFGFTVEELKWIQPAYSPTRKLDQVLGATNGRVIKIANNIYDESLIIAGDFTELDSLPCLNIGTYKNNQLSCLGSGIEGVVNDVVSQMDGTIFAFGELHHNGTVFPVAKYDGSAWTYLTIPNRDNATSTTAFRGGSYQFEVSIYHNTISGYQEIWRYLNNNTWKKIALLNGSVLDISASSYGRVHVGHFDSVVVYNSNAQIDTTLEVKNVVIRKNYTNNWYGLGNEVSDTVKTAVEIGNALFFGGSCTGQLGNNNVCISRFFNATLQPLFLNNTPSDNYSVNTIVYGGGDQFTFGGDFEIQPIVGVYGNNLATYNLSNNRTEAVANLNEPVNTLIYKNADLFVGGDFHINTNNYRLNYLGKLESTVGLKENKLVEELTIFPNPFNSTVYLKNISDGVAYSIVNIDGRTTKRGTVKDERIKDLDFLPKGTYFLTLETQQGKIVKKIIK